MSAHTLVKNFAYLYVGELVSKLCQLIFIILFTRYIGAESFGKISFAISLGWLITTFSDFGISAILFREMSADPKTISKQLSKAIGLKSFFSAATIFFIIILLLLIKIPADKAIIIIIIATSLVIDSIANLFRTAIISTKDMAYESFMKIIYGASKLIFLFVLIAINANLIFASTAYLLSSILTLIFSLIILRRKIGKILPEFDKKYSLSVLKESYPLVYWFFFVMLLSNLDVIFLSWLKGDYITGIYSAPSRFMINGFILAEMIIVAAYPHFVEHYKKDQKRFVRVIQTLTSAFFIVVLPISAISMIFNKGIITIVFGSDFTEGSSVFGIFSLILFLYYFIVLYGGLFIIARRIKMLTLIAIFVTAVQIITTYFMILKFSFNGAAYATLLSYLLFAVLAHVSFKKYSVHINIEKLILKIIPVFLLLLITLYLFRTKPVTALILIPTYFILLIIFKVVDRENVFLFFDSINLTKMARMFKQK